MISPNIVLIFASIAIIALGIIVSSFLERRCDKRANCYRILHAQSLHTANLERLSVVMRHDFFTDYSKQLYIPQNIERV